MEEENINKFFPIESGLRDIGLCPLCSDPINENEFRDTISKIEFRLSGMCQLCMDKIFGKSDD